MSRAVCPSCGAAIEPVSSGSKVTLCCHACGWSWVPARKRIQELQGVRTSEGDKSPETTSSLRDPISFGEIIPSRQEAEYLFSPVLKVSKPRPIKWGWPLWVEIALAVAILTVSARIVIVSFSDSQHKPEAEVVLLLLFLTAASVIGISLIDEMPRLELLRKGDIAVGRVVSQKRIEQYDGWFSAVVFAFVDEGTRPFVGQAVDRSKNLGEGAPVVVFYDAQDPNHNTVLEACSFKVQVPAQIKSTD
jgi:hypothetical protein